MNSSSQSKTLLQHLELNAAQKPQETAFIFLEGKALTEATISHRELVNDAKRLAATLVAEVPRGERVMLLFPPGLEYIRALMACFYAGVVAVPLFPPRVREKNSRLANVLADCDPRLVLSCLSVKPALDRLLSKQRAACILDVMYTDTLPLNDLGEAEVEQALADRSCPSADDVAFLQYTSGSTGDPKGVMVTHGNVIANLRALESTTGCHEDDIFVNWLPLFHDLGLVNTIFLPIYLGTQSVLMAPGTFVQSPACWFEAISRYRGTICGAPNFAYELCVQRISEALEADLSSWRLAFNAAEPIKLETLEQFAQKFAGLGFDRRAIYPSYGMAEATVFLCGGVPQRFPGTHSLPSTRSKLVSCGAIAEHHQLIIVDPDSKQVLGEEQEGEIWVRGPSIARGYWGREAATADVFHAVPLNGEHHYLRTGDLGVLSQGQLYVTGRIKELIIVNGQNYYPNDLEHTAQRAHDDLVLGKGAALSVNDKGVEKLVLVQELKRIAMRRANEQAIFDTVSQAIGDEHQLALHALILIKQGSLPLTSSGKIQRVSVSEQYGRNGFAEVTIFGCQADEVAPIALETMSATEHQLCQMIETVCKRRVVSLEQNFYQMGLDSLQQSTLLSQINLEHNLQLSLVEVAENNTVAALAQIIDKAGTSARLGALPVVRKCPTRDAGLSPMQTQLYRLWKAGVGHHAYTESKVFALPSQIEKDALHEALMALVDKHALLTARVDDRETPLLVCDQDANALISYRDFDSQEQAEQAIAKERVHEFDLISGPLCRITLITTPEQLFLQFTLHHMITDGWSMAILIEDLNTLYRTRSLVADDALLGESELGGDLGSDFDYQDYVSWLQGASQGNGMAEQIRYWQTRLADLPLVHQLPLDHARPATQSYDGVNYFGELSPLLSSKIDAFCRDQGVTPSAFMQAGFALLLSYLSGETDIVMGTISAGRRQAQWQRIVGLFTNTLVSRITVDPTQTFLQLLRDHQANSVRDFDHQELPFEAVLKALKPARSPAYHPLFQVWFVMQNVEQASLDLDGPAPLIESQSLATAAKYELALYITPKAGKHKQYTCQWQANTALFSGETLAYFALQYVSLLEACLDAPQQQCSDYPILQVKHRISNRLGSQPLTPAHERQGLLTRWDDMVAQYGEALAVTDGEFALTYRELAQRSEALAGQILSQSRGQQVGLLLGQQVSMAVAILAALKAGKTYVPLDPQLPLPRLHDICEDAQISMLLCHEELQSVADELVTLNPVPVLTVTESTGGEVESQLARVERPADSVTYILYTSGSTGKPKGVYQSDANVGYFAQRYSESVAIGPRQQVLQLASFSFDASVMDFYGALLSGATLHIKDIKRTSLSDLQRYMKEAHISLFHATPTVFKYLFREFESHAELQAVVLGGEAVDADTLNIFQRSCKAHCLLINGYGPTESTLVAQRAIPHDANLVDVERAGRLANIGQTVPGTDLILRNEIGKTCRVYEVGEIHVVSPHVALGYWNDQALTHAKFTDLGDGTRQYATGDLARYLPDGSVEYLARKDSQIKLNGIRIELSDIKYHLSRLAGVQQTAVQLKALPGLGWRLVAYVQMAGEEHGATHAQVQKWKAQLAAALPDYMVPSFFVPLADFPRTATGKVDHARLPLPESTAEDVLPFTEGGEAVDNVIQPIQSVWQALLNQVPVNLQDNFFDLGGNSLLMMQLQQALNTQFGVDIKLTELFALPTISAQAQRVRTLLGQAELESVLDEARETTRHGRVPSGGRDIAIIGMSGQFPGASDVEEYWQNIRDEVESIRHFDQATLREAGIDEAMLNHPDHVASGAPLAALEQFDAGYFAMSPKEASLTCPQQRLLLENAVSALEHGGYGDFDQPQDVGVFVGTGHSMYMLENLLPQTELVASLGPMTVLNANSRAAMRISYKLNLSGPSVNVDTACSTSAVAVAQACDSLVNHQCQMALAGGASVTALSPTGYIYETGGIKSQDGHCRVFDQAATGTVFGSGSGLLLLKRLEDAVSDGDLIHAVIKGWAVNNDGSDKVGYTAPSAAGQTKVIRQALANAGVSSRDIGYVETHGTGTKMGDPIEIAALSDAFASPGDEAQRCALGAVKANIGHLDAAAGVAGIIKTVQALKHRTLPGNLHVNQLNANINLAGGPFRIHSGTQPWVSESPRTAGVSSFGIGGTNAHLILQEAPVQQPQPTPVAPHLFPVSGKSESALKANLGHLQAYLADHPEVDLQAVAWTLQHGRQQQAWRQVVVGHETAELQRQLLTAAKAGTAPVSGSAIVVFMFAGQGTQTWDMGRDLYDSHPVFADAIRECAAIFEQTMQLDIIELLFPSQPYAQDPSRFERRFADTANAQPALFAIEYALAQLWLEAGLQPSAMIGHSLGEYVAACLSGVMSLEDACYLVAVRSQLMAQSPDGAMVAVIATQEVVASLCGDFEVSVAVVNGPTRFVLAGTIAAVEALQAHLNERAINWSRLNVGKAFHSPLMEAVLPAFADAFSEVSLHEPRVPLVSNVTGVFVEPGQVTQRQYWCEHLRQPVAFSAGIAHLLAHYADACGPTIFIEIGPGGALGALVKGRRHADGQPAIEVVASLPDLTKGDGQGSEQDYLLRSLGAVWRRGGAVRWPTPPEQGRRLALPTYAFQKQRHWIEAPKQAQKAATSFRTQPYYAQQWRKADCAEQAPETGADASHWLIFSDGAGFGAVLAHLLEERGASVVCVEQGIAFSQNGAYQFTVKAGASDDIDRVLSTLKRQNWFPDHLAYMWPLDQQAASDCSSQLEWCEPEQHALMDIYQAITRLGRAQLVDCYLLTHRGAIASDAALGHGSQVALSALCQVIAQEDPLFQIHQIDLDQPSLDDVAMSLLLDDLYAKEKPPRVAYRDGVRMVPELVRLPTDTTPFSLSSGTYVITGGLGRIGLSLAAQLAMACPCHLVLLTRQDFPEKATWSAWRQATDLSDEMKVTLRQLQALEREGVTVSVLQSDVTDLAQLRGTLDAVTQEFGAIKGIIHCAGQVEGLSQSATQITAADLAAQALPKMAGARNLQTVCQDVPVEFVVLMSSISTVLGGLGYSAYAAANAWMDSLAFSERHNEVTRWRTINWDTWLFDSSQGAQHGNGIPGMDPSEGLAVIEAALNQSEPQLIYAAGDVEARLAKWVHRQSAREAQSVGTVAGSSTQASSLPRAHEASLRDIWHELLGVEHIGTEDTFFDLGGDSLLATRLVSLIRQRCGVEVSIEQIYQSADFAGLATLLEAGSDHVMLPAIAAVPRDGQLPLSFAQQRLWFIDQLAAEQSHYVIPSDFELNGEVDVEKLHQVFNAIIARHEVLRTHFSQHEQSVTQHICKDFELPFTLHDLSDRSGAEQEAIVAQLFDEEASTPFDLMRDILFRATLIKLASDRHRLLITMHHIASDGWSRQIFIEEFTQLYLSPSVDAAQLPALPIQYADYAHWQRDTLAHPVMVGQLEYWRKQLAEAPALHSFPLDRERPEKQSVEGHILHFDVPADIVTPLRQACEQHKVTLFAYLQTVFAILISRYSHNRDVVMGTAVSGRSHAELSDLIGFFVNTLVLRSDFTGALSFAQALSENNDMIAAAFSNQHVPFDQVVEDLNPERSVAYNALFQIMFSMQTAPKSGADLGSLEVIARDINNTQAKFDIELDVTDLEDVLRLRWRYSTALFDEATMTRVAKNFLTLLVSSLEQPNTDIMALPMVSRAELARIEDEWNNVGAEYPLELSVNALFEAQAQRVPEQTAVIYDGEELSYRELDARANQLAQYLLAQGVRSNQLVGIYMERSIDMLVAMFGILKAGAGYLPLDVTYPLARLQYMLSDSGTSLILTQMKHQAMLKDVEVEVITQDAPETVGALAQMHTCQPQLPVLLPTHERLAYVIYTSGSTGMPKGVKVHHRSVTNFLCFSKQHFMLPHIDGAVVSSPLTFDATVGSILVPLVAGGYVELLPENDMILEVLADYLLDDDEALLFKITPAHLEALSGQGILRDNPEAQHVVVVAGEALRENVIQPWRKAQPNTLFINEYGPTEATVGSTIFKFPTNSLEKTWGFTVPIGAPIENSRLYVMNEHLVQQPIGVVGELYIAGEGLAAGYLNRDELNAERFVSLTLASGQAVRAYRTGDLVRWNDTGNLEFFGRTDHQVKLRGFRVELDEIQSKLLTSERIQACLVTDYQAPDDSKKLAAYIALDKAQFRQISAAKGEEIVDSWQEVHDEFYDKDDHNLGVEANFSGWNSSYTGEPIVVEQMLEWLDLTMSRILALAPQNLLEIGSGGGLLLYRYADKCDTVTALDISHQAIAMMQKNLDDKQWDHVALYHDDASGIARFSAGQFDTIVLNSVVQYFPNEDYLTQLLEQAVSKLEDGGHVFIGDVRNLDLFEPHLATVEAYRLGSSECQVSAFAQRIQRARLQEHELLISPAYFKQLGDKLARVSDVDIQVKLADGDNELMRYRYDVVIRVGGSAQRRSVTQWHQWEDSHDLAQRFLNDNTGLFGLHSVPHGRVEGAVDLVRELKHWPRSKKLDSRVLQDYIRCDASLMRDIETKANAAGYQVAATWSQTHAQHLDFVFWQGESPVIQAQAEYRQTHFTNLTNISKLSAGLSTELNQYLAEYLPEFMLPDIYVFMEQFPLTPNGKVDRKALPTPDETDLLKEQYQAPETRIQTQICQLWEELLQVSEIGINDNFFSLGGDSVTSIQMVSKAKTLGLPLKVRDLFEHQTVVALAQKVEQNLGDEADEATSLDWVNQVLHAQGVATLTGETQITLTALPEASSVSEVEARLAQLVEQQPLLAATYQPASESLSVLLPSTDQPAVARMFSHVELAALPEAKDLARRMTERTAGQDQSLFRLVFLSIASGGDYLLTVSHRHFMNVAALQQLLVRLTQPLAIGADALSAGRVKGEPPMHQLSRVGRAVKIHIPEGGSHRTVKAQQDTVGCLAMRMSTEQTALLLGEANDAYQTHASELLMAAVHQALCQLPEGQAWQLNVNRNVLTLNIDQPAPDSELFRLPVVTRFTDSTGSEVSTTEPGALIKRVKERNRQQMAQGYQLLSEVTPALQAWQVNFHYVNHMTVGDELAVGMASPLLAEVEAALGEERDSHLIDIEYWTEQQQLSLRIHASEQALAGAAMTEFSTLLPQSLAAILAHCQLVNSVKLKAMLEKNNPPGVDEGETLYL
ncbi:amino acid adenylation domain-containing protein [Vibrio europaeus]|nr:non-ribosomal peptide synthetase/type I polyketide synthase [Vibrio europaeus]MDC5825306.1 amino acid adenylation domain-containing protein [Vibrio europaeus]